VMVYMHGADMKSASTATSFYDGEISRATTTVVVVTHIIV